MKTAFHTSRRSECPPPGGHLEIVRARTADEVDRLETPWRALDAPGGCPASHFGWSRACLGAFAEDAVDFMAAATGHELVAIAPLVRRRLRGVRRLLLAGVEELHEPMGLVGSDENALARLTRAMVRSGSPVVLGRIPADSPVVAALARTCRGRALLVAREESPYPYIQLDESWIEPQQHLNAYCGSLLRRARLTAERIGPVATEIHTPRLHELPGLLDVAVHLATGRGKRRGTGAVANDPHRAVFYRQYAETACVDGALRICFLRIGDHVAAAQMAIERGSGFWLLLAGEDHRYRAGLPGRLLLRETIRYAAEADLQRYEFWGGTDPWTPDWATHNRRCVSLRVYPFGARGLAALVADAAVAGWIKWRKAC